MKDKAWLAFVRELPCMSCHLSPAEPHHVGTRGMGLKVPDSMVIPLCRECHRGHHDRNDPSVEWCRERLAQLWAACAKATLAEGRELLRSTIIGRWDG